MAAPVTIDGRPVALGASIGIATYPGDGRDFESLLKKAGGAMQRAKDIGRNTFQFYEETPGGDARERFALAGALRAALDGGPQMQVHYQPQFELASGRVTGFEALVRWRHPDLGDVPPQKFIRIAEANGYMGSLGTFVMRQACLQLRALASAGVSDATMSVNVSVAQLHDTRFAQRCLAILREAGIPPRRLDLEVTESVLLQDRDAVLGQLALLRESGVAISIDDFGTGYSSLSYLRHLPISRVKIDRSFVHDMLRDRDAASIVQAIVALAHTLHHTVIAEGVESAEHEAALRALGCDEAQGFHFARPMPAPVLVDWLLRRRSPHGAAAPASQVHAGSAHAR
jgi:EAL domain-containing protein (putative c-di-GMP-specific phosphodiesterase class I)